MAHLKLGEILLKQGLVTEQQLNRAIDYQRVHKGRIGEVLIKLGIISEETITAALGIQLGIPYVSLESNADLLKPKTDQNLDKLVPADFAKKNVVLPISKNINSLTCALSDPLDLLLLDNLR